MTDLLIIQSHGAPPDNCARYLRISEPLHREYAARCGADYQLYVGAVERDLHPAWNRIPLILDAFQDGYRKVVWLDADTLVVDPSRSIFDGTDDTTPLHMCRTSGFPWPPYEFATDEQWEAYNDGVLVVNARAEAMAALMHTWDERRADAHMPQIWELSPLLDWIYHHRDIVAELDARWNWMPFAHAPPREEAAILGFHGMPHDERWARFQEAHAALEAP